LSVNRDSPYADQVLLLAADSEMRRGRKDRALATLHSLLKDYPGSPLAPLAKKNIAALEGDAK
jgi:outer membrane protein assembly factor BamD (BamD/ComL family)